MIGQKKKSEDGAVVVVPNNAEVSVIMNPETG